MREELELFVKEFTETLKDKKEKEKDGFIFNKMKELIREGVDNTKIRIKNSPKVKYLAELCRKKHCD